MLRHSKKSEANRFTAAGVVPRSERGKLANSRSERHESGRRLEREDLGGGKILFTLVFPTPEDRKSEQKIPLNYWTTLPKTAEPIANAVLDLAARKLPNSRKSYIEYLDRFARFLKDTLQEEMHLGFSLRDVSKLEIGTYINWLDRIDPKTKKEVLAVNTRRRSLGTLCEVLENIWKNDREAKRTGDVLDVPKGVWPGSGRQHKPTEVIQADDLAHLIKACVKEITGATEKLDRGRKLIEDARHLIPDTPRSCTKYTDLGVRLAAIDKYWPGMLPEFEDDNKTNPKLMGAVVKLGGINDHARYFYPSPRELIPFALLLGFYSAYNPDPLLKLTFDDITMTTTVGETRIVFAEESDGDGEVGEERMRLDPIKGRAGYARQLRTFPVTDDVDNPAAMIEVLRSWTARIRPFAAPRDANRLFLFLPEIRSRRVKSFEHPSTPSGDTAWTYNLGRFIKDHNLKPFTLKQMRPTSLEVIHGRFGGDLRAVMAASGHKSVDTFDNHYTSDAARQRNYEALAGAVGFMWRDRAVKGRSDARREAEFGGDSAAATPGWGCLDPYDSPISGQRKGRACEAYGKCPICPLAQLDGTSPVSCARSYDLLARVDEAREELSPDNWRDKWGPVRRRLTEYWLPQFSADVREGAKTLNFRRLPPVE